ncbi:synaptotagmin-13-like [Scleropages formosus]|uniref:Synaptotagmin-13-like n=1 Tax=Scleropages formosus TaxID=113540 RepID=A0A0P7UK50_SCLFO|nr:synaptotagmin-13-like [Scleropages formosus]
MRVTGVVREAVSWGKKSATEGYLFGKGRTRWQGSIAVLTLCWLSFFCKSYRKGQLDKDADLNAEKVKPSVLHSTQQFSVKKFTEPIQPRPLLKFPTIYRPKPSITTPEVIGYPNYTPKTTDKASAETPATAASEPDFGNLATDGSEEVFIMPKQDSSEDASCTPEMKTEPTANHSPLRPKLHFSVTYLGQQKELLVTIIEGLSISRIRNLRPKDQSVSDSACVAPIGPVFLSATPPAERVRGTSGSEGYILGRLRTATGETEARTTTRCLMERVRWEEPLAFPLPKGYEVEGEVALSLRSCRRFSQNLGDARFKLADVGMMSDADCWVDLQPPKQDTSTCVGELLLSVSYLPAANRLGVVVMKARELQSDKLKDTIDLSVKLTLKHQSSKLKKKQTRRVKHKMNPVWNEMMMLEVPQELLPNSSLELEVLNQAGPGKVDTLGRCQLGLQAFGTGIQHWQQMLDSPRKQIAMWHPLHV